MVFGSQNGLLPEDKPAYIKAWSQPGALTGGLNYYRANRLRTSPLANAANASSFVVSVPTLVIWGEKICHGHAKPRCLAEFVPQLTIKRIPDASHWLVHKTIGRGNLVYPRVSPNKQRDKAKA